MQDHTRSLRCAQFKQPPGGLDDRVAATAAYFFGLALSYFCAKALEMLYLTLAIKRQ